MTIKDAVRLVDRLKPNSYSEPLKVQWLSKLDGQIWRDVISTHRPADGEELPETFDGYSDETPIDTELLVAFPYDEDVYSNYLQAMIDKENGETGKYNVAITMYNAAMQAYSNWYNRTHMPIAGPRWLF